MFFGQGGLATRVRCPASSRARALRLDRKNPQLVAGAKGQHDEACEDEEVRQVERPRRAFPRLGPADQVEGQAAQVSSWDKSHTYTQHNVLFCS